MSRTAIKSFGLFIIGQIAILVGLLCLNAQNAYAQTVTPLPVIRPEDVGKAAWGTSNQYGLVIGGAEGNAGDWTYIDEIGNKAHLELGDLFNLGGIYVVNGSSLTFSSGYETQDGGAIAITRSGSNFTFSGGLPVWLDRTTNVAGLFRFTENRTTGRGGAIYNFQSELSLSVLFFDQNAALGPGAQSGGGAIFNDTGRMTIEVVHFTSNTATRLGGAIFNRLGTLTVNADDNANVRTPINHIGIGTVPIPPPTWLNAPISDLQNGHLNVFRTNTAVDGGALYNLQGTAAFNATATNPGYTASDTYVAGNQTPWSYSYIGGAGIRTAINLFDSNSTATGSGGAIYDNVGTLGFTATSTPNPGTMNVSITSNVDNNNMSYFYQYAHVTHATAGLFRQNIAGNYGGAIYSNGTVTLQATADPAVATANATANANNSQTRPWGESAAITRADTEGGVFTNNTAGLSGGAIHFTGNVLSFTATAQNATATATATATSAPSNNNVSYATAVATAEAYAIAKGSVFSNNTVGDNIGGNYTGIGGAIYTRGGTLMFNATANAASATANANPTANRSGNGSAYAGANATARATANATGAEFINNRAMLGGAIFTQGGVLTFEAALNAGANGNAYANANATPTGNSVASYANYASIFDLRTLNNAPTGTLAAPFNNPNDPFYDAYLGYTFGSRAYAKSTAYGAIFENNLATNFGGAIYNDGGTLRFATTSSTTATAYTTGALIDNGNGNLIPNETVTELNSISKETLASNLFSRELPGAPYNYLYGYPVAVADVAAALFHGNSAGQHGGAIYITNGGTMSVIGTTRFRDNVAGQRYVTNSLTYIGGGYGGAIYNDGENVTFSASVTGSVTTGYSTFTNNIAERGGALYNNDGVISFWNDSNSIGEPVRNASRIGGVFGGGATLGNRAVFGGALYNTEEGTINLANVVFAYNNATDTIQTITITGGGLGGAIYNAGGNINLYGGIFTGNSAVSGGAIYHTNPNNNPDALLLIDSTGFANGITFESNSATAFGGAIYNDDVFGTLDLTNIVFRENRARLAGAALWSAGTVHLTDALFISNNRGGITANLGGAIFNTADENTVAGAVGTMTFRNTTFQGNIVSESGNDAAGGAIYNEKGDLTFTGTTNFIDNRGYSGGAIYNLEGTITMTGGTFGVETGGLASSNIATWGGAIYNDGGILDLTNVNFYGNVAHIAGGAIYSIGGEITLNVTTSSIFRNNHTNSANESIYFASEDNTLVVDVVRGTANSVESLLANPQIAGLQMYDPMRSGVEAEVGIGKTGLGTWLLAGVNNLSGVISGTTDFGVGAGTLYLYQHNYSTNPSNPDRRNAQLFLGNGRFELSGGTPFIPGAPGATLIVDGAASNQSGSGSEIQANGGIILDTGSTLALKLTTNDLDRSRLTDPEAALTLSSVGTIRVGGTVEVYLTYLRDSNDAPIMLFDNDTWFEWFAGGGVEDPSIERKLFLIDGMAGLKDSIIRVFQDDLSGDWEEEGGIQKRGADGIVRDVYVIDEGWLKKSDEEDVRLTLYWTGEEDTAWDTTTTNWFTQMGTIQADTFIEGDHVRFVDRYDYYTPAGQFAGTRAPERRTVDIDNAITVGSMAVTGGDFIFNLAQNVTLRAALNPDTIKEDAHADPDIYFGTARINAGLNTNVIANHITFANGGDFGFDLDGAVQNNLFLTLTGNVSSGSGAVGGGNIYISNMDDFNNGAGFGVLGDSVRLIKIEGDGKLTNSGNLIVDPAYEPLLRRSDEAGDVMIGLGLSPDEQELSLMCVDATGNTILDWTGRRSSTWDVNNAPNWTGTLNGVGVTTFMTGDRVRFGADAVRKTVTVASGGVTVGDMDVTGSGYRFDLTRGGITADAGSSLLSNATGDIHFGSGSTIVSGLGSYLTAGREITFGADTIFEFELTGASAGNTLLTLDGTVDVGEQRIGSGRINVRGSLNLAAGSTVTLVDAGVSKTTASTGELYVNGSNVIRRGGSGTIFGLATEDNDSKLLLKWVSASANSTDLVWTPDVRVAIHNPIDGKNYYVWGATSTLYPYPHWKGTVDGISVNTFLNGDTVFFNDPVTVDNGKYVVVNEGGVKVNSMTVNGTGYTFDLRGGGLAGRRGGGITATNNIHMNDATIAVGIRHNEGGQLLYNQIIAEQGQIILNGASVVVHDTGIDSQLLRDAGAQGKELDILLSNGAPIDYNGKDVEAKWDEKTSGNASAFYDLSFSIENGASSGRGVLKLSYMFYENLGRSHNTTEAGRALDVLRDVRTNDDIWSRWSNDRYVMLDILRGTELVADSLTMTLWRPWEITHQRTRNVREESGWNSWGGGYYRFGNTDSDGNAGSYDTSRMGTMVGADYGMNKYWQFGGAFGYALPQIQGNLGKVDADDLTLGFYSKINVFDQAWISSFIGYGYQTYNMTRYGLDENGDPKTYKANYDGDAWYASVEFVKPLTVSTVSLMPLVALDHQTAWTNSFSEGGSSPWSQTIAGTSINRTMVRVGVDSKIENVGLGSGRVDLATRLHFGYLVDGTTRSSVVAHFPNTNAMMTLYGVDMRRGQANVGLTASGEFREKYQWYFDLDGYAAGKTTALQGSIGVSTRF